ncbi:MAG: hypothetical protein IT307_09895 [Chloroflexi bacterium]|nr:hypothetical protein [Chloroflexota bacterium]
MREAVRASLATVIADLLSVSATAMGLAFVVTLCLDEIPLRTGRHTTPAREALEHELTDVSLAIAPNELHAPADCRPPCPRHVGRLMQPRTAFSSCRSPL